MTDENLNLAAGANEPTEPAPLHTPPSLSQTIFFGADGLRAGWGIVLFALLFSLMLAAGIGILKLVHPKPPGAITGKDTEPGFMVIAEALPFLGLLLVSWVMSKIEGRRSGVYGLGGAQKVVHFVVGLAWGVACLSALVLALWKTGFLVFDGRLLSGRDIVVYAAVWLLGFTFVGLSEEYMLRGYLQYTLARGFAGIYRWAFKTERGATFGFWTAAFLLSTLFGLGHGKNPGESPIGLLSAGLVGLVFCLSLWRTGSLWWAIGFHASWDWAQSFLYGVADSGTMVAHHLMASHPVGKALLSGGTTGPEGSILVLPVLLLTALIIVFTLPRTGAYAANMPAGRDLNVFPSAPAQEAMAGD